MKDIELPRRVVVGEKVIDNIGSIVSQLGLEGKPLVVSDETTHEVAGSHVEELLGGGSCTIKDASRDNVGHVVDDVSSNGYNYLVAVGGGTVIDVTKVAAHETGKQFISVPTSTSHDGIVSSQASIKGEKIRTNCPLAVIADTAVIKKAPHRLLAAGCADAISNYTAVLDWRLAHKEKGEYYGDYAATLSMMSSQVVMENIDKIDSDVSILVEALISSGVAMGIAGSSRPASGAEHQFSHTLDMICEKPALHGEQCGVGSIMMAYLHEVEWTKIRDALKRIGAPTTARELGIPKERIIEALTKAHDIRDRYTILRDGLCNEEARELVEKTGVA